MKKKREWEEPYRRTLLLVLGLVAVLPHVRTGTAGHVTFARCALVFYVAGLIQAAL